MILTCECNHPRSEHQFHEDFIRDKYVKKCKSQNCTCTKYRGNEDARHAINYLRLTSSIYLAAFLFLGIIISLLIMSFANSSTEIIEKSFNITPKTKIIIYENGTQKQENTTLLSFHETLQGHYFLIEMMIPFVFVMAALYPISDYHEAKLKILVWGLKK